MTRWNILTPRFSRFKDSLGRDGVGRGGEGGREKKGFSKKWEKDNKEGERMREVVGMAGGRGDSLCHSREMAITTTAQSTQVIRVVKSRKRESALNGGENWARVVQGQEKQRGTRGRSRDVVKK